MTNLEEEEAEELRPTKYPNFRVASGGKGPPDPPDEYGHDWLSTYEVGTTFCTMRINSKDCDFELFLVLFKSSEVVLLQWRLPDGKIWDKYVSSPVFSKMFKPGVILGVLKPEASEEDTDNGYSNRSNRPADLVLHETVPGDHSLA